MKPSSYSARLNYICVTAALGGLLFGFDTAVISGAIGLVKSQFALDTAMEGWLVSCGLLGCIIGVLLTGIASDRIGRRKTILLAGIMFLVSGIGCAFASGFSMLVAARLIGGIGVGMASVVSPMYIAEFAPAASRGRMIAWYQLAITVGILLAYFSNAWLVSYSGTAFTNSTAQWFFGDEAWRPMFVMMAIPSVAFLALLLKVPESPRWLIASNQKDKARDVLEQVRSQEAAAKELDDIVLASQKAIAAPKSIFGASFRLPLIIGIVLAVLQQFSGINAIIYYGPSIFKSAGIDSSNALLFQVIIGAINLGFTIIAIKWVDKYGRKKLLAIGLSGIILSLVVCGFLFYTGKTQGIVLLIFMLMYIACFAFSLGPITWIVINEIFPTEIRVKAVSICTMALWVAVWIVGQFFPWLLENFGPAFTFWSFAVFSLINFIFSWKIVKETKGKSLEEMENVFIAPH